MKPAWPWASCIFRNGHAAATPEMQVEFPGGHRIKKDGKNVYGIQLGKTLKIKGGRERDKSCR